MRIYPNPTGNPELERDDELTPDEIDDIIDNQADMEYDDRGIE